MNLTMILGGAIAVLVVLLGLAVRDDIAVRADYKAFTNTQTALAKAQAKENERLTKSLTEQRDILEANNAKAVDDRKRFDVELDRMRNERTRANRVPKAPVTAAVCADKESNDRLAESVSRYRSAVDLYRDAVGDFRISVLTIAKDSQQCVDTLNSCQSYVESICRAGLCE